jgi:hypothetical protein
MDDLPEMLLRDAVLMGVKTAADTANFSSAAF